METTPPALAGRIEALELELRRRESQEGRLRQIVETAFEGILTFDPRGVTTFANPRASHWR